MKLGDLGWWLSQFLKLKSGKKSNLTVIPVSSLGFWNLQYHGKLVCFRVSIDEVYLHLVSSNA